MCDQCVEYSALSWSCLPPRTQDGTWRISHSTLPWKTSASDLLFLQDDALDSSGVEGVVEGVEDFRLDFPDEQIFHEDCLPLTVDEPKNDDLQLVPDHPYWCPMRGSRCKEVLMYSKSSDGERDVIVEQEVACVLKDAFAPLLPAISDPKYDFDSISSIVDEVKRKSNYEVRSVTRIQNLTRLSMHNAFARCYDVHERKIVYHGTSSAHAASIAKTGFRGGASNRALYGKGIYTSGSVWEALAYAAPKDDSDEQTFLVVELLAWPCAVGEQDQVDFGCDENGAQILTTTTQKKQSFALKSVLRSARLEL